MLHVLVAVLVGLAVCQVAILLTTVYLHRCLAHRSLTLAPGVVAVCRVLIWLTTGIRPRQWAAVHRKHHAFTDVEGDPHSPVLEGFWRVQLGNAVMYRRVARDGETVQRYARDIPADRWDQLLFDHAVIGLGLGVAILVTALGWRMALVAAAVHAYVYLALNAAINAVGHRFGKAPYPNTARNNQWLALLTAGEGHHNNHHAAPTSARLGFNPGELDPGWWLVRLLARRRWARVRHSQPRLRQTGPAPAGPVAVGAPVEEPVA
ncbi:MAG TPA: fatty acid desaturase [Acidimicrobiales bacterium]|nr:fatty acid desaturase [Acidimicrobiales bacterium]